MSSQEFDLIQRIRVENGVPRVISTTIKVIEGGEDLLSHAIALLKENEFYKRFVEHRRSQYIGYKLKDSFMREKRYELILSQRKDKLLISIVKELLDSQLLNLKFRSGKTEIFTDPDGRSERYPSMSSIILWVIPSQKDNFFKISEVYDPILSGNIVGEFNIDPNPHPYWYKPEYIEDIDPELTKMFNLKINYNEDERLLFFDHSNNIEKITHSNTCLLIKEDKLFPYTWQVSIDSVDILEEFIDTILKSIDKNYF